MSKQAFKIMGVLIFTALLVSLAVGGVSAAPEEIWSGTVEVPPYNYFYPNLHPNNLNYDSVGFDRDLGILAVASLKMYGNYTLGDVQFDYSSSTYNISSITTEEGLTISSNSEKRWVVFVKDYASSETLRHEGTDDRDTYTGINDGGIVEAYYVTKGTDYETAKSSAEYYIHVDVKKLSGIYSTYTITIPGSGLVDLPLETFTKEGIDTPINRQSVLGALDAASKSYGFTYNISKEQSSENAVLVDINNVDNKPDGLLGYGWVIKKNGVTLTAPLDEETVASGDTLTLTYSVALSNLNTAYYKLDITIGHVESPVIYQGSVDLVKGTYFNHNGQEINFDTDLGVLALASLKNYGDYTYGSFQYNSANYQYNLSSITTEHYGTIASNSEKRWVVFVNEEYSGDADTQQRKDVGENDKVTAFYVEKSEVDFESEDAFDNAEYYAKYIIDVTVSSVSRGPSLIDGGTVYLSEGTFDKTSLEGYTYEDIDIQTGLGAFEAAQNFGRLTYSISNAWGPDYTVLHDVNGIAGAWSTLGYDWAIFKNDEPVGTLDLTPVSKGDELTLYYCYQRVPAEVYYDINSALYKVQITIDSPESATPDEDESPSTNAGPTTNNILWSASMGGLPDGSPVVHDGKVYVTVWMGGENSGVYCFAAENTGNAVTPIWKYTGDGAESRSGIVIQEVGEKTYLYFGYMGLDDKGTPDDYADDVSSGGVKCLDITNAGPNTPPVLVGDTGNICAVAYVGSTSQPVIFGDRIWIYTYSDPSTGKSALYSFDLELTPESKKVYHLDGKSGEVYTSITVTEEGIVYLPYGEGIAAFDLTKSDEADWEKNPIWYADVDAMGGDTIVGTPLYYDQKVYFIKADYNTPASGKLYAVNATHGPNGIGNWEISHKAQKPTTPVTDGTYIYATGSEGLTAYPIASQGSPSWTHPGGETYRASPTLSGDIVYYGTKDAGTFFAISTTDAVNREVWKYKPETTSTSFTMFEGRPVVANGILYVGSETVNTFYAFGTASSSNDGNEGDTGNTGDTGNDGLGGGSGSYVPPVQTPSLSYTSINPGTGTFEYTTTDGVKNIINKMTPFGVLVTAGNSVQTSQWSTGIYVESINGLADNDATRVGWMYSVNGVKPSTMANNYPVKNGDKVVWFYGAADLTDPSKAVKYYAYTISTGMTPAPTPTPTPTETQNPTISTELTPAKSSQVTVGIPKGVEILATDDGQSISIDTAVTKLGETSALVNGNDLIIVMPGVKLTVHLESVTWFGELVTATIKGATIELLPAPVKVPAGGYDL